MSEGQPWLPGDVYFGGPDVPLPDWRAWEEPSDADDDASPSAEARRGVAGVLGFDPAELDTERGHR